MGHDAHSAQDIEDLGHEDHEMPPASAFVPLMPAELPQRYRPAPLPPGPSSAAASAKLRKLSHGMVPRIERRRVPRAVYQAEAFIHPAEEGAPERPHRLYTRDLDASGVGFISRTDLSAIDPALLHLPAADGRTVKIEGRVRRSREVGEGWFEGVVEFTQQHPMFSTRRIRSA